MVVLSPLLAIAVTGLSMRYLGLDIAQVSAALFVVTGAAPSLDGDVSVKEHCVRGAIVVVGFSVSWVLAGLAVHAPLN